MTVPAAIPAAGQPGEPAAGLAGGLPGSADDHLLHPSRSRRLVLTALIAFALITQAAGVVRHGASTAETAFIVPGSLIFIVVTCRFAVFTAPPGARPAPWPWLCVIVTLGIALFAVGQHDAGTQLNWVSVLTIAAAACGRFTASLRPTIAGAGACVAAGLVAAAWQHYNYGNILTVTVLPAMAAFFAYTAGRRNDTVTILRRTRAELAMMAVAQERLRIARDLHDLLGHSLSLITLKAELAGRLIRTDADRAAREIAELESVARRSLTEVRGAVTGYRQPDLQVELAAARQLLSAAGIACKITVPGPPGLAPRADALLAWTVREAVTNVVRHSGADRVSISVRSGPDGASVEVTDDGDGPGADGPRAGDAGAGPGKPGGTGLAGLAERVGQIGGKLTAGATRPRGFRLRVTIPAAGSVPAPAAEGPADESAP